ncbi:MAG: hypothetical protein II360_00435 [Muribaculaceae bacterium]|nr:hypothetical protein [Muribaculaceae bacterium]
MTKLYNFLCKAATLIALFLTITLASCESDPGVNYTVRPTKIDMSNVSGFAVLDNANASRSGETAENVVSLYSVNDKNEITLTVFYFEVTSDDKGNETKIQKELSNAVQVVPSFIADLGKYILFAGCQYQIVSNNLSDEARDICNRHFPDGQTLGFTMEYLIRKSDGALFDVSRQELFAYLALEGISEFEQVLPGDKLYCWENVFTVNSLAPNSHLTSSKGNLFIQKYRGDIAKVIDQRDALEVATLTQSHSLNNKFGVDKDENIYILQNPNTVHVYLANNTYNAFTIKDSNFFDIQCDNNGNVFLFTSKPPTNGNMHNTIHVSKLTNAECTEIYSAQEDLNPSLFNSYNKFAFSFGYINGAFWWFYGNENCTNPNDIYLVKYDPSANILSREEISSTFCDALTQSYDATIYGAKCYGANIDKSVISVTEMDVLTGKVNNYTYTIKELDSIVLPSYSIVKRGNYPHLRVKGRSTSSGASVQFEINLISGQSTSSFGTDGRNTVTFLRLN